jgi:hypothetical protein
VLCMKDSEVRVGENRGSVRENRESVCEREKVCMCERVRKREKEKSRNEESLRKEKGRETKIN